MKLQKGEREVLNGFHDTTDKLKSDEHKKGRHYVPKGADNENKNTHDSYPAVEKEVDDERVKMLEDEGFIGTGKE